MLPGGHDEARRSGAARVFRCTRLFAALLLVGRVSAAIPDCQKEESKDCIKAMLGDENFQKALKESKKLDPSSMPIVYLVLNHETLEWSLYRSKPPKPIVTKDDMATLLGPDGNPRVVRSAHEKLVLIVRKTNPFLYSYEGTVSPPQYSPDAGTIAAALSAIAGASFVLTAGREGTPPPSKEIGEAVKLALDALESLVRTQAEVQRYVRWLELGGEDGTPRPSLECVSVVAKNGLAGLDEFERLAETLPVRHRSCYQIWTPIVQLAALPAIKTEDLTAARAEMLKISAQSDYRCEEMVRKAFSVLKKLEDHPSNSEEQRKILNEVVGARDIMVALVSDKVLSARKDFIAAAAQLEAFVRIGGTQALLSKTEGDGNWPSAGRVAVVAPPFPSQSWLQDNPGTISIKPDPSVYSECPRLKPTGVDKKFLLVCRRQACVGYGFGVTAFKRIVDPTFGAVYAPGMKVPTGEAEIARTAGESHWGTIVAMVFLRARPLFCRRAQPENYEPGLEFGIGLNSKKMALFLGPSLEIRRFVRLGVGVTCQAVTRLADGLTAAAFDAQGNLKTDGTEIVTPATPNIRTQSTLNVRLYVGLTFALDALPLFSSSK